MIAAEIAAEACKEREAMQQESELASLLSLLEGRKVVNVLEVGSCFGGTLWAFSYYATGELIAVDTFVLDGTLQRAYDVEYTLLNTDSASLATRRKAGDILDGAPLDFLFIDGDHRYDAVKADAANWLPLLAPDGIAAFHDICHRYIAPDDEWHGHHDMWRAWDEISAGWQRIDIYDPSESWGGIGVLLGPEAPYPPTLPAHAARRLENVPEYVLRPEAPCE